MVGMFSSNPVPSRLFKRLIVTVLLCALAACQPTMPTPSLLDQSAAAAKQLATVYMSPTPGDAQRQATRAAILPSPTPKPPTPVPSITPYIGVFIGEAQDSGSEGLNPALLNTTPSAEPVTPSGNICQIEPNASFGIAWRQNDVITSRLGCPIQIMFGFDATVQIFEHGVIYWRKDTRETWAIQPGGTNIGTFWDVAQPPNVSTTTIVSPPGLRVPTGDIGGVWLGVPGVRDALGFAQTDEQPASITMQLFDSGALFFDSGAGQVFVLIVNGDVYGPY